MSNLCIVINKYYVWNNCKIIKNNNNDDVNDCHDHDDVADNREND
jgi:hypothetical protein